MRAYASRQMYVRNERSNANVDDNKNAPMLSQVAVLDVSIIEGLS